jgi:hypothetical protein
MPLESTTTVSRANPAGIPVTDPISPYSMAPLSADIACDATMKLLCALTTTDVAAAGESNTTRGPVPETPTPIRLLGVGA